MVVTYTLASWARGFCTAAAFKQASGLQHKMAASDQTHGRFRPDMPNVWVKNQNGVSNYPMAYQINVAYPMTVHLCSRVAGRLFWPCFCCLFPRCGPRSMMAA